ncbi:MAG: FAD-dependent monooxygenase [Burkholderiaceae bacterium]
MAVQRFSSFPARDSSAASAARGGLPVDVCVVGGGAVGKAAALGLARVGARVVLAGGASAPAALSEGEWDARVYALNRAARELLASLKVWDAMDAARLAPVDRMVVEGGAGAEAGRLTFDADAARVDALAWIVEDANLNRALDAALAFSPDVRVVAAGATGLTLDADRATVQLTDGETIDAALVVGADGGNSWVRARCDIGLDLRRYGQTAVVANFHGARAHHGTAWQRFTGEEGIVALLPLPGDALSLVWSAPDALAESLMAMPAEALAERLTALAGDRFGTLRPLGAGTRRSFPLSLVRAHAMTAPRVALVGDAAHVIHPLAGQGMNLGFGDVAALIGAVAQRGPHRDCGDARVLGRYARARAEEVRLMQIATDGLERLFSVDAEPLRMLRAFGMNLIDSLPVVKRRLVAQALGTGA